MKTSRFRNRESLRKQIGALIVFAGLVALGHGCDGGREGERCNPLLSHNDCDNGLTCQQPATCAENYCCPADPTKSANPYCNGGGCPVPDAGSAAGGSEDASAEAATTDGGAG